jgi:hypothetical protein
LVPEQLSTEIFPDNSVAVGVPAKVIKEIENDLE